MANPDLVPTLFVSHAVFKNTDLVNRAFSPAGDSVQNEIIESFVSYFTTGRFQCINMPPNQSWPLGVFYSKSFFSGRVKSIGYFNLPILKSITFAYRVFLEILACSRGAKRVKVVFYNSYFFENLAAVLAKIFLLGVNIEISCILQDAHVDFSTKKLFRGRARSFFELIGIVVARRFDWIYPVSKSMICDLGFDEKKCTVYFGGMTSSAYRLIDCGSDALEDFAVFAGGLEEYNGVKFLLEAWCEQKISYPIHIFGRGSLEEFVRRCEIQNPLIIYHGFVEQSVVESFQSRSRWNFCLRYSLGINSEYFFPSKIFNTMAAPGALLMNRFSSDFQPPIFGLFYLEDNLSNLLHAIHSSRRLSEKDVRARRDWLLDLPGWKNLVEDVALRKYYI